MISKNTIQTKVIQVLHVRGFGTFKHVEESILLFCMKHYARGVHTSSRKYTILFIVMIVALARQSQRYYYYYYTL